MRQYFTWLVVLFVLVSSERAGGQQTLRFASAVKNPVNSLPILAAEEKGFWKEQGLDVDAITFTSGGLMSKAMAAGQIDMGITGGPAAIQSITAGVPEIIVSDLRVAYEFYIWVRADGSIRTPQDLKGAKVSVTSFGGMAHAYARAVTKALGLEGQVRIVAGGGLASQIAALKSGAFDAGVNTLYAMAPLKVKGEVRDILLVHDYLPKDWMDYVIVARLRFSEERPEDVRKAIRAFFKAAEFVQNNRSWSVERMKSYLGYSEQAAQLLFPRIIYGKAASLDRKRIETTLDFLVKYDIVKKERLLPLERLYNPSFISG